MYNGKTQNKVMRLEPIKYNVIVYKTKFNSICIEFLSKT